MQLAFNIGLNSYSNPTSIQSDFKQFDLGTDLTYSLSANTSLIFHYDLQNFSYQNDMPNDYLSHKLFAGFNSSSKTGGSLQGNMLFETQSGDLANHQFSHINPVLTYVSKRKGGFFKTRVLLDSFTFSENSTNNFLKMLGEISLGSDRSILTMGGFYKSHPENETANYARLMVQYTRNSKDYQKKFSLSGLTSLFPNEPLNGFTDFHGEISNTGGVVTTSFNLLLKLWHNPGDADNGEVVKPHVVDLYFKLGFNMKYLVVGPVVGLHGNVAFGSGQELIERDGNLLRFGGFADLDLPLSDRLRILGQGSFELGNVYTNNYTGFNDGTGEIVIDGVYLRHPTSLQLSASAQYSLSSGITLFARGGYYLVKTGFDPIPGMYPVQSNSRFYLLGGAQFRLN